MWESFSKGMAGLVAFLLLGYFVSSYERDIEQENELIRQDPIVSAQAEFEAGHYFFYRFAGLTDSEEPEDYWQVVGEHFLDSNVLESHPERRDMQLSEKLTMYVDNEKARDRALGFAMQFNREMNRLLLASDETVGTDSQ